MRVDMADRLVTGRLLDPVAVLAERRVGVVARWPVDVVRLGVVARVGVGRLMGVRFLFQSERELRIRPNPPLRRATASSGPSKSETVSVRRTPWEDLPGATGCFGVVPSGKNPPVSNEKPARINNELRSLITEPSL